MATLSMKFFSPALQTKTNVNILIPTPESTLAGHQETFAECAKTGPFPVLYLLHGTLDDRAMGVCHTNVSSMPITDERPELRMCPFLWHSWA